MSPKSKLEEIMRILKAEDYEISRAIENHEDYLSMGGQSVDASEAALTFYPIYGRCKMIYDKPWNDVTNLTDENSLSFKPTEKSVAEQRVPSDKR